MHHYMTSQDVHWTQDVGVMLTANRGGPYCRRPLPNVTEEGERREVVYLRHGRTRTTVVPFSQEFRDMAFVGIVAWSTNYKRTLTHENKVMAFGAETWTGAGLWAPNMVSALDQTIRESLYGETANWRVLLVVLVAVVVVDAGDMMRKSIVFDKKTPEVFYCPQHKPTGFDKLLVRARPLSKLCQFGGQPIPEDYKSDCYNDVDESEYACKEKYRIMKRLVQKKDNQVAEDSSATTELFPTEDY
uniref:Uncharacterized protein n=1 Tax=Timema cristinae TaxID=61476 RepID=A0A7R9D1W4_TIMCR|nr:unnamed protein product [Timema cristinae]